MATKALIVQTAFIGDAILVTPLIEAVKTRLHVESVSVVVKPETVDLLNNNPWVDEIIPYDKNQKQKGISDLMALAARLAGSRFDTAYIPHRSFRSALLCWLARIPVRVGFMSSEGRWFLSRKVPYSTAHEVERNLALLPQDQQILPGAIRPSLYPDDGDSAFVDALLHRHGVRPKDRLIGVSPGSIWATKRWMPERFAELVKRTEREMDARVVLFGGWEDSGLCTRIANLSGVSPLIAAGEATLLQSAELVGRCAALVSNDSAMAHISSAIGTPVVDIFGPTMPSFGFAPYGEGHRSVEHALSCRPCGRHGGSKCPIGTHECMTAVTTDEVYSALREMVTEKAGQSGLTNDPSGDDV